jgi:sugar/nucleoside kinase (ribokinase family)
MGLARKQMINPLTAVIAGHICLDLYPDLTRYTTEGFHQAFLPGHLLPVGPLSYFTGGPVSNTALALHQLGISTKVMGKVGDDFSGQVICQIVARYGQDLSEGMIIDPSASTSYTIVITPPGADRYLLHYSGANDTFVADDVRYELLNEARVFHFGYPPLMRRMYEPNGAQLVEIFKRAKSTGITTSLDMAFPDPASPAGQANWRSILESTLPNVDIFLPSIEEILMMLRPKDYKELLQRAGGGDILPFITSERLTDLSSELLKMGTRVVGFKLGYRGFYLRTAEKEALACMGRGFTSNLAAWAEKELWSPCFTVDVVGTAGAGDATIAGFLSAVLRDFLPEQAVNAAVAVGACNVEAVDTLSGIRTWDETMARIGNGWKKRPLDLVDQGWVYNGFGQLWSHPVG